MRLRSIIKVMLLPHRTLQERARLIDQVNATEGKLVDAQNHITELTDVRVSLQDRLADLTDERNRLGEILDGMNHGLFAPPGHFYSPIPSKHDVEKHVARHGVPIRDLPGVGMDDQTQMAVLEHLSTYYPQIPFQSGPAASLLYHASNPAYSYTDGIILFCMLNHLRPRRVIEIGSGYSTCAILDTNRTSLGSQVQITSIEPHAELLRSLIGQTTDPLTIIESKLQDVDLQMFDQLESRDVLFIDSTHVSKLGSDVNYIFFDILPRLKPGVVIHLHDIYAGFEYPDPWVKEGRAWNEAYLLRAFLQYNERFRILLFISYMQNAYEAWFQQNMPDTLLRKGGCFWMEKL
jgi:predicted O-methyltransferase YrrM